MHNWRNVKITQEDFELMNKQTPSSTQSSCISVKYTWGSKFVHLTMCWGYTSCVDDFLSVVEEHRCMLKIESCMLEQGTPYIDAWSEHDHQQSHHLHQESTKSNKQDGKARNTTLPPTASTANKHKYNDTVQFINPGPEFQFTNPGPHPQYTDALITINQPILSSELETQQQAQHEIAMWRHLAPQPTTFQPTRRSNTNTVDVEMTLSTPAQERASTLSHCHNPTRPPVQDPTKHGKKYLRVRDL